jgi:hypothetical protein
VKALASKNARVQKALFPFMQTWASEHMGIEQLNVADTLAELVRDNSRLCSKVPEDFFRVFILAIRDWGRRARWLGFFQIFMVMKGRPLKKNQDLILRLLLDEEEAILDLTCDYRDSPWLYAKDERLGKHRLQLMIEGDHKRPVYR